MNSILPKLLCCAILALWHYHSAGVNGHTYHLGSCAVVEPMPDFDMNRFLGKWYAIQKTSTGARCLIYNFTRTSEPNEFKIEQVSEHPVLGLVHNNQYHYTGSLRASPDVPARMTVKFPWSVAGSASYVVFMTDYETYAGIYTCQKLAFANRRSATILSRSKTLDKVYLDKLRSRLSTYNVNPYDLSLVNQSHCEAPNAYNLNITSDTLSAQNIGKVVKKAGEKLGDGVEYVVKGAGKVYDTVFKKDDQKNNDDFGGGEVVRNSHRYENERVFNSYVPDNDAEWL